MILESKIFDEKKLGIVSPRHRKFIYETLSDNKIPKGDIIELGSYIGRTFEIFCEMFQHRTKIAVDSFEGLSKPTTVDSDFWHKCHTKGTFTDNCEEEFLQRFSAFKKVKTYKGWIPQILSQIKEKEFAIAHLDLDLYNPTLATLNWIYPKLKEGAIVLLHDYFLDRNDSSTLAIKKFALAKGIEILLGAKESMAGFFIKK